MMTQFRVQPPKNKFLLDVAKGQFSDQAYAQRMCSRMLQTETLMK